MSVKHKGLFFLLALLLIFVLPPVMARWLYQHAHEYHLKHTNVGYLLKQPIATHDFFRPALTKHWHVVLANNNCCDSRCQTTLHNLQQIHTALGKSQSRVMINLMQPPLCKHTSTNSVARLAYSPRLMAKLKQQNNADTVLLIDPHGNLVLTYPTDTNGIPVLKDLKHLLRVSQIG